MKKELLVPAGSMESLKMAILNGADAIYVGGKKFGARAYAKNFTDEELKEAVKLCHKYDVKLHVTVNTIVYESETAEVLDYIDYLNSINVDALIIEDIGLIKEVHKRYPNLALHSSTQLHTFNLDQIKFLESIGVTRCVLDRELSLDEIKKLNTKLELEVFIHGALCISYSGECLISALSLNRSGNRGECAGLCRMPYKLLKDNKYIDLEDKYILSTKELNTSSNIKDLLESNITSFKIEGRMKSPEYTGFITYFYRKLIDNYYKNKSTKIDEIDNKNLLTLYNREFTTGYLFNNTNILNMKTPNHQGIHLGNVIDVNTKFITIKLDEDLTQEDGIRFTKDNKGMIVNFLYNNKGLLINKGEKNSIVKLDNKLGIKSLGEVRKTISKELNDSLNKIPKRYIDIEMSLTIKDDTLTLVVKDNKNIITKNSNIVSIAKNAPVTKESLITHLTKTHDTIFNVSKITIDIPNNIFIPMSKLNELRREVLNELEVLRSC